jgi:hypothetical protein
MEHRAGHDGAAAGEVLLECAGIGKEYGGLTCVLLVEHDLDLAGPYAQIGETDNWGATAYFHHVNATGGILGHKVDYIVMNNQSSASESELIARKCILADHAQFIVGSESGADTEAALPIAIAYHTILISLSSGWQTNGYPASELNSWGFPGFYDVFYEDQLASVQQLIVPRHYTRVALLEDNSQEGWDAGLEINWAVTSAGTLDETAVMHKLQHLDINTLGIVWARTPANYENISQVLAAMEVIAPGGTVTLYNK